MELILVALCVGAVTVLAIWGLSGSMKKRSARLRNRFHSEYDHERARRGQRRAEKELLDREERVQTYSIRPLNQAQYDRFSERWKGIQEHFVDDPASATIVADHLVKEVMETRGYPAADFDQRAADLSVDHPRLVTNYRKARHIAEATREHRVDTEQLRHAFVAYRALFDDLLVAGPDQGRLTSNAATHS